MALTPQAAQSQSDWHPSYYFQHNWSQSVKGTYEDTGYRLKSMVMPPVSINGQTMTFPIMDFDEATEFTRGDDVKVMNLEGGEVKIDVKEFDAAVFEYMSDRRKLGVLAPAIKDATTIRQGNALGRKHDREILTAIHKHSGSDNYKVVGSHDEAWDLNKAMEVNIHLTDNNVSMDGQINGLLPAKSFMQMMTYPQFSESGYVGPTYSLVSQTGAKTFLDINWHRLPDSIFKHFAVANTADKKAGKGAKNGYTFYIFHKFAVGSGQNMSDQLEMEYQAQKKRWFINKFMDVGATVIHDFKKGIGMKDGIIECRFDNSSEANFSQSVDLKLLVDLLKK